MINDGYTTEVDGIYIRPLLSKDRGRAFREIREGQIAKTEKWIFAPPYVEGEIPNDEVRKLVFRHLVNYETEQEDLQDLKQGVLLYLQKPLLFHRTCEVCRAWWFDEDTGYISVIGGQPLRRPKHARPICETSASCIKGHWLNPQEMSERNKRAFNFWLEYRYVGCPHPEDPIVRRNWNICETLATKHGLPRIC